MNQKIEALNEKEIAWVNSQLEKASKFVKSFSPQDAGSQAVTLAELDRAFAEWIRSPQPGTDIVNATINFVGVAFGQFLVDHLGLKWVIATDEHGSDLAVYGLPGTADILIYPANFVAKRWERREINFLSESYNQIAQQLRSLQREV